MIGWYNVIANIQVLCAIGLLLLAVTGAYYDLYIFYLEDFEAKSNYWGE